MINYKFDASNNITFPEETRKVMVLIDGEFYRIKITRICEFEDFAVGEEFSDLEIKYELFKEDRPNSIGCVLIRLNSEIFQFAHRMARTLGFKEIPDDFFELEKIEMSENVRVKGLGTALLNYVLNDIKKFNETQGQTLKIIFERSDTKITLPFYKKFGARENARTDPFNKYRKFTYSETTPMIIDDPQPCGEVPHELADDYDYEKAGLPNPFTTPQKRK